MRNSEAQQFLAKKSGCITLIAGLVTMALIAVLLVGLLMGGIWLYVRR